MEDLEIRTITTNCWADFSNGMMDALLENMDHSPNFVECPASNLRDALWTNLKELLNAYEYLNAVDPTLKDETICDDHKERLEKAAIDMANFVMFLHYRSMNDTLKDQPEGT